MWSILDVSREFNQYVVIKTCAYYTCEESRHKYCDNRIAKILLSKIYVYTVCRYTIVGISVLTLLRDV